MKKVLTIAGSDCSGGAGIQADLKTILAHECYGMSVITALTAQNTRGVHDTLSVEHTFVESQLRCVFDDIYPDAIKIGMLLNKEIAESVSIKLFEYKAKKVVFDPVMVSSSGRRLLDDEAISLIKRKLLPLVEILTPNICEAEVLSGVSINSKEDMINSAKQIELLYKGYILIKGGHSIDNADDLLYKNNEITWFSGERIENSNSHGTGCTLSSAIASNLALGYDAYESVGRAKLYINRLLENKMNLGHGSGPLNHIVR
ncbi:MAG: bifunctional hydroxymethylpyrimidine kinase/phosphomethylpyrimidine kinase [Acidaminobacteraceae bacterium]